MQLEILLPHSEIAERLGEPLGTIETRLRPDGGSPQPTTTPILFANAAE